MNKTIITHIILLMLLATGSASAQEVNKLYLGDVSQSMEQTVYVPVYLDNASDQVTAVQFDIELPSGLTFTNFSTSYITLNSERIDGHTITVSYSGQTGRILLASSSNKPLKGSEGELLRFPVRVGNTLAEGQSYGITLKNVFVSDAAGNPVDMEVSGGNVTVEQSPDFEVSDVKFIDVDSIAPGDTLTCQYTVRNVGGKATTAGFYAYLYVQSSSDYSSSNSISHSELLEPGEAIVITDRFPISNTMYLAAARVWPKISISPLSGSGELSNATSNNNAQNTADTHVLKTVYRISPTEGTWNESSGGTKYIYLYRYGNTSSTYEYFDVKIEKGDARVSLGYSSVYFRYNYSTNTYNYPTVKITNDDEQNEDDEVIISFTKQSNPDIVLYGHYKLVDDDLTGFRLIASNTSVTEGETFQLTATLPAVTSTDVEATVSISNYANYFSFPSTITIPAGEQSVTFDVTALDDEVVSSTFTATFSVVSSDYTKGSRAITRLDNDNNLFSNIVDEEWELIKAIYQKTNGANWSSNRWTLGATKEQTGSLAGVTVINGHVRQLAFAYSNMNCELIPEFFMFPMVKSVNLQSNKLTGDLESVLASLSNPLEILSTLNLSYNNLTGNLGTCNFAELMPALETLNVANNMIRDITPPLPASIKTLTYSGQKLNENVGIYSQFYTMTSDERFALLPTVLTYNHQNKSYPKSDNYMLSGDDWNLFSITLNNTTVSIGGTNYVGSYPWNRLPSGQVMTLQNKRTENSVKLTFDFEMGDVNYDTSINISDMQRIIVCALQPESNTQTLFNYYAANIIEDDVVNVQDVVAQINLLLDSGITPSMARRRLMENGLAKEPTTMATDNCLYVADGCLMLKSDTPVAALDIVLDGNEVQWTEALSWFTQKQRGGRTIFYSLFGDEIPAGETVLATYSGDIFDAMIVDLEGNEIPLSIGLNEVNGIYQVEDGLLTNDNVYDLSGRIIVNRKSVNRKLPKGLYIVNGKKQVIK